MPGARTHLLAENTFNALKHMMATAYHHPVLSGGAALALSAAVIHYQHHSNDSADGAPDPSVYQGGKSALAPAAHADFTGSAMMPPVRAGLDTSAPAYIQQRGAGYDNAANNPPASAMGGLNLGAAPMQRPLSSAMRMNAVSDSTYMPSDSRMNSILSVNNF